jgi:precorrin-2 dehydrogenase/sirohydrochlorin ferrochelatase
MGYLSFNLQLENRAIVIIGGGSVAQRKAGSIVPAGATLTVISPTITFELQQLRDSGAFRHIPRAYQTGDLDGAFLVIAATNSREVNLSVATEARSLGILAEITDNPAAGDVTSPAVIRKGDLSIAISTNNRAPALSAVIKRELSELFGHEYAEAVHLLGIIREKLLAEKNAGTYNKQVLSELAEQLPHLITSGATAEIDALFEERLGPGYSLASLKADHEDPL